MCKINKQTNYELFLESREVGYFLENGPFQNTRIETLKQDYSLVLSAFPVCKVVFHFTFFLNLIPRRFLAVGKRHKDSNVDERLGDRHTCMEAADLAKILHLAML